METPQILTRESIVELIQLLTKRKAIEQSALKTEFRNFNHLIIIGKLIQESLSTMTSSKSSIISNNLGMIMQRLTLITIILMVPTVIASFFGMNVPVPMSENNYSFLYIFLGSILMSVALAFFFRRKRLL